MPVGNRLAKSRLCRRQHELARLQDEYGRALEAVRTEVDIAVRELQTSYLEIGAKSRALAAAEAEANTIEARWLRMVDGSGTAALNLESLLRAQELLTYNLAMINLKRANGTLLLTENVKVDVDCENGCKSIDLDKTGPSNGPFAGYKSTEAEFVDQSFVDQGFVDQGFADQGSVPQVMPAETQPIYKEETQLSNDFQTPWQTEPPKSTQGNLTPDYFRN